MEQNNDKFFYCKIEFSASGKIAKLTHRNGSGLATLVLEDDSFYKIVRRSHYRSPVDNEEYKSLRDSDPTADRAELWEVVNPNIRAYCAEVFEVDKDEIDLENETIKEKDFSDVCREKEKEEIKQ